MTEIAEIKSCGFLLVQGQPVQSFLLMKHQDRWDLPKGHTEPGETELECAYRETEEETGLKPSDIELDPTFCFRLQYPVSYQRNPGVTKLKELVIFLGSLSLGAAIDVTEHIGFEWFPWNPPHKIQAQTIDPLLAAVAEHLTDSQ